MKKDPSGYWSMILKGESEGHPFRGNQYTDGQGGGAEDHKEINGYKLKVDPTDTSRVLIYHATRKPGLLEKEGINPSRAGIISQMNTPLVFFARSQSGAIAAALYEERLKEQVSGKPMRTLGDLFVFEVSLPITDLTVRGNGDVTTSRRVEPSELRRRMNRTEAKA